MKVTLLLTATIAPGAVPALRRSDPAIRRRDYLEAFRRWLTVPVVSAVVFCDNSGAPIDDFQALAQSARSRRTIEILSFEGQQGVQERGKGLGEMRIIEHALQQSATIAASDVIVKMTGRLFLRNANVMLAKILRTTGDVICDLHKNLQVADSRVFAATPAFLRDYLVRRMDQIDDRVGRTFEVILARAVHEAISEGQHWALMPVAPYVDGISGTLDLPYPASHLTYWKREVFRAWKQRILAR